MSSNSERCRNGQIDGIMIPFRRRFHWKFYKFRVNISCASVGGCLQDLEQEKMQPGQDDHRHFKPDKVFADFGSQTDDTLDKESISPKIESVGVSALYPNTNYESCQVTSDS